MITILPEYYLLKRIEEMKKELVEMVCLTGINSKETISYSEELDFLLNIHMKRFGLKNQIK